MASVYLRGDRWWCRLKDEAGKWISRPTEFAASDKRKALRYATAAQKKLDARHVAGDTAGPLTVAAYGEKWLAGRQERGVRAIVDDRGRLTNHAFPHLGALLLAEVKPRHVRDMVRALRQSGELAARTILNVYGLVHTMFRDALVDELIESNPCVLHRGELPAKVDKDLLRVVTHTGKATWSPATRGRRGARCAPRWPSFGYRCSTGRSCRLLQALLQPSEMLQIAGEIWRPQRDSKGSSTKTDRA